MSVVVVDASVWVSRLVPSDAHHARCQAWLRTHTGSGSLLVAPALVLAEVAGAISRRTSQPALAHSALELLQKLPNFRALTLDAPMARLAAQLAADHSLRGADAAYVAAAARLNLPLLTLDEEQSQRAQAVVTTLTP
jgi:predicted nucleic acid-binding protein